MAESTLVYRSGETSSELTNEVDRLWGVGGVTGARSIIPPGERGPQAPPRPPLVAPSAGR